MWCVSITPHLYHPSGSEQWCIINDDGDVHDFYPTQGEAAIALSDLIWRTRYDMAITQPKRAAAEKKKLNMLSWLFGSFFATMILIQVMRVAN